MKIRMAPFKKPIKEKKATERKYHKKRFQSKKIPCPICSNLMSPKAKNCQKCMGEIYSARMQGSDHPFWKGGKIKKNGYVMVNIGNDKYTPEHRIIWEKTHNCKLPQKWHIHHLNGIKDDNRPQNLVALSSHKHALVLAVKSKRIQELESLIDKQLQLI